MQLTAKQLAEYLQGKVEGDETVSVQNLAKIEEAQENELSFIANPKYQQFIYSTGASIVIVNESFVLEKSIKATLIRVKDAYSAFSTLLEMYRSFRLNQSGREDPHFVHSTATIGKDVYLGAFSYIGKDAVIGDSCKIYPNVYIGENVKIGDNSTLFPGAIVYFDCIVGKNNIIHAGAVIGGDGFGFAPQKDGTYSKVTQIGNVIMGNNVEIGANTTVDRATMGSTVIRDGVKLDNLIQIAHNVEIGENTVVAAQTGISGSTKVGKNAIIGGQVGVVGHAVVADGSQIQAKTGVNRSIDEPNKRWSGNPMSNYTSQLRSQVLYLRLPELEQRIKELEKLVMTLENVSQT